MKNYLGEKVYSTYSGWRAAINKKSKSFVKVNIGDSLVWEGDKDICNAFIVINGIRSDLGQWDGAEGFIVN